MNSFTTQHIVIVTTIIVLTLSACAPQPQTVEIEVTTPPQVIVIEVTATPTPKPPRAAISVGNAENLAPIHTFEMPNLQNVRETCGLAFSPDGTLVATVAWDGTVVVWVVSESN